MRDERQNSIDGRGGATRRTVLATLGASIAALAGGSDVGGASGDRTNPSGSLSADRSGGVGSDHPADQYRETFGVQPFELDDRIEQVTAERRAALESFVSGLTDLPHTYNSDYDTTVELHGQEFAPFLFTKGMPLEDDENGVPYREGLVAYERKIENYRKAILERGNLDESFEQGGQRTFIGVPAVHTVTHTGMDPWRGRMPPAPSPTGPRNAGEMIDLYAMEQFRDVHFTDYPNEPGDTPGGSVGGPPQRVVGQLNGDLGRVERELGESWWYDTDRLFVEADTDEVDWGPFLSQYLLHDVRMWALPIEQRYLSYEPGVDYNGTRRDWLDTLEGWDSHSAELSPNTPDGNEATYISTGRDLATIVNAEPPYQEYLIAALHLFENGAPANGVPYNYRIDGSIFDYTGGGPTGLLDLVARGARQALVAAFYQKWYEHFRCRPETYAGRVHAQRHDGREFGISELLTNSAVLSARRRDTDLLTTAYVEGSPVHPAYPSGHSVIAGTCGTILKTMFANSHWIDDYYVPGLDGAGRERIPVPSGHAGVYQEIDKLMSNIGLARMFAGVHYYSDHYWGIKLGEQVAVAFLLDFFERVDTDGEAFTATFSPFLDYDTEYDVSLETLETLREQSLGR